jgi:hypothetical protein
MDDQIGTIESRIIKKRMSLAKLPSMKDIGRKLTTSTSQNLGNMINKSRLSFPINKHLWVILLTLFTSLVLVVNALIYLVIKCALIEDPEDNASAENPDMSSVMEPEYKLQSNWKSQSLIQLTIWMTLSSMSASDSLSG